MRNVVYNMKSKILWSVLTLLFASACGGLAGEPEVVATLPSQSRAPSVAQPASEPPDEFDLELGAQIYAENCTRCHGISGMGDGEFVLSGEVTAIPDFTDPASITGKTISDYFQVITNGNMAALMPPWAGSLSETERWAAAAYTYGMAGDETIAVAQAPTPATTEEAAIAQTFTPVTTEEAAAIVSDAEPASGQITGSFTGTITNGTEGATLPDDLTVTLRILDTAFSEETLEQTINPDGSYSFEDVVIHPDRGYVIAVEHDGLTFNSQMLIGNAQALDTTVDLTVFETTTDPDAAQIKSALSQVDRVQGGVQIVQLLSFENTSDRAFFNEGGSVRIPLPQNAQLVPDANDLNRFTFMEDGRTLMDTRPLLPDQQHVIHLIYFMPQNNLATLRQELDYEIAGPLEVYLGSDTLELNGDDFISLGSQQAGSVIYRGYVLDLTQVSGSVIEYGLRIVAAPQTQTTGSSGSSTNSTDLLAYGLMAVGVGLLAIAGVLFWYLRDKDMKPAPVPVSQLSDEDRIQLLMRQIADLDNQHEAEQISRSEYERERGRLKSELKVLMQTAAGD